MSKFYERLRVAREYRGLNQKELSARTKIRSPLLCQFESGARKPSFDNLRLLADALDVTGDYLLGRVDAFNLEEGTYSEPPNNCN